MKFWLRSRGSRSDASATIARRYRRRTDVISRAHGSKIVLLNLRSETFYSVDEVGGAIWASLESTATVDEICERLAPRYDAAADELRADVESFVADLVRDGLAEEI